MNFIAILSDLIIFKNSRRARTRNAISPEVIEIINLKYFIFKISKLGYQNEIWTRLNSYEYYFKDGIDILPFGKEFQNVKITEFCFARTHYRQKLVLLNSLSNSDCYIYILKQQQRHRRIHIKVLRGCTEI